MTQTYMSYLPAGVKDFFDVPAIHDLLALVPTIHNGKLQLPEISFDQPWMLWGLVAVPVIMLLYWTRKQPAVAHSHLPAPRWFSLRGVLTVCLLLWSTGWLGLTTASLVSALAHPQYVEITPGDYRIVRDLHFVLDTSSGNVTEYIGSEKHVSDEEPAWIQGVGCGTIDMAKNRKIDAEVYAACKISEAFPSDRKSLATFSGVTQCCIPSVTLDPRFFHQKLRYVNQQLGDNQSNYDTKEGVFYQMLEFIKRKGKSTAQVLLLFTDGDGTMTEEQVTSYSDAMKKRGILLVCGGPGKDTVAYDPESDALVKLCKAADGLIVDISKDAGINQVVSAIKELPPSEIKMDSKESQRPIHEGFILLAGIAFCFAAVGQAALGRIRS